ncbi:MAG: CfrBI family restriction endonuclease [Chloroflexota bacterium]|nr:CfrBI family restriction endonuclease [Chloroflexota bacterium]
MAQQPTKIESLLGLMGTEYEELLSKNGMELVKKLGAETIKTMVFDVLSGENLRNSTETLTRRRLAVLNAATVAMFLKGTEKYPNFIQDLPQIAERILKQQKLSKAEKWVTQWALGLTGKARQNVLRDDATLLTAYRKRYVATCEQVIQESIQSFGPLNGELKLGDRIITELSWKFMVYLLATVGAQTLTIRGSDKSIHGKLFEPLILGTLLSILGFKYIPATDNRDYNKQTFWLSSSTGDQRESDATALIRAGQGVRFDIGFIGRGNTEISLDKVTRFARESEINDSKWFMATIIIVDRIGKDSQIQEIAQEVGGDIVQMSMGYWPQEVAQILHRRVEFEHPLVTMPHSEIREYLQKSISSIELLDFLS